MSFLDFLAMHDKTDVPHDDTDMSLPFKDCNHYFSISLVVLPTHKISLINTAEIILNTEGILYLRQEPKLRAIDIAAATISLTFLFLTNSFELSPIEFVLKSVLKFF